MVAFNLQWADGSPVGFAEVGRRADEDGIQLRTGCFCNVGACQEALGLSSEDVKRNYALGRSCADTSSSSGKSSGSSGSSDTSSSGGSNGGGDVFDIINGRPSGAVRVRYVLYVCGMCCAGCMCVVCDVCVWCMCVLCGMCVVCGMCAVCVVCCVWFMVYVCMCVVYGVGRCMVY